MMTHNKYKFAWLFTLLLLTTTVFAASEAEYKKLTKTWTLNADGSQEFHYYMELTLFTHTAMNSTYGESFIIYNSDYQTLKINDSYTKQKDGTIIRTPDNAFVECLPFHAADAPAYNQLKEMVVVHTGLELGCTIYLDYTITSKAGYLPEIDLFEPLCQTSPVKEYTLQVVTPVDKSVSYQVGSNSTRPSLKTADGKQTLTWSFRNLPASSLNPFVNLKNGDVPYLAATTYASAAEAAKALYKQFNAADDVQLETLAENLTEDKSSTVEKLQAILSYTEEAIATNPLTLTETGYRLRRADDVINTAYATEVEAVNLLTGLLRGAGYTAEPVATYRVNDEKGLALSAISHLYVTCKADGKEYLLAAATNQRPQVIADDLLISLASGEQTATGIATDYQIQQETTLSLTADKVTTKTKATIGEALKPNFAPADQEKSTSMPLKSNNGYATIQLPEAKEGISALPYGRLNSSRSENLRISRPVNETYTYTIECSEGVQLQTPAVNRTINNRAGSLTISIIKQGNTATVTRKIQLSKQVYTSAEYADLRTLLTEWYAPAGKTLLFSVK